MNQELKSVPELLEEERKMQIAAYNALPSIFDLVEEDKTKALETGKHITTF